MVCNSVEWTLKTHFLRKWKKLPSKWTLGVFLKHVGSDSFHFNFRIIFAVWTTIVRRFKNETTHDLSKMNWHSLRNRFFWRILKCAEYFFFIKGNFGRIVSNRYYEGEFRLQLPNLWKVIDVMIWPIDTKNAYSEI